MDPLIADVLVSLTDWSTSVQRELIHVAISHHGIKQDACPRRWIHTEPLTSERKREARAALPIWLIEVMKQCEHPVEFSGTEIMMWRVLATNWVMNNLHVLRQP